MIFMQMYGINSDDDANDWGIQLGSAGGYKTSGYTSSVWDGPNDNDTGDTNKLRLFRINHTGGVDAAGAILWKGPGNVWMHTSNAVGTHHGCGYVDLAATVTKLKLMLQESNRDFDGGSVSIQYM